MKSGAIKFYVIEKGYGFIVQDDSDKDIFFHHSGLNSKEIVEGDRVTYEEIDGKKGPQAVNIEIE